MTTKIFFLLFPLSSNPKKANTSNSSHYHRRPIRSRSSSKLTSESESGSGNDSGDEEEEEEEEREEAKVKKKSVCRERVQSVNEVTLDETLLKIMPPKNAKLIQKFSKLSIDEDDGNNTIKPDSSTSNSSKQASAKVTVRRRRRNSKKVGLHKSNAEELESAKLVANQNKNVQEDDVEKKSKSEMTQTPKENMCLKVASSDEGLDSGGVDTLASPETESESPNRLLTKPYRQRRIRITSQSKLTTGVRQVQMGVSLTPVAQRTRQKNQQQRLLSSAVSSQAFSRFPSTHVATPNRQKTSQTNGKEISGENVHRFASSGSRIPFSGSMKKTMTNRGRVVGGGMVSGESDHEPNALRDVLASREKNPKSLQTNLDQSRLRSMLYKQEQVRAAELNRQGSLEPKMFARKGHSQTTIKPANSTRRGRFLQNEC